MRRNIYLNYPITPLFGWGVYGLNLALAWVNDPDVFPVCSRELAPMPGLDPLRRRALQPFLNESRQFHTRLKEHAGGKAAVTAPVLSFLEEDFRRKQSMHEVLLSGRPTIGVVFLENTQLPEGAVARAAGLPMIVTGSTWNERILRAHGLTHVKTVFQGVDPTLFHVAPRAGVMRDRFTVFSGGKMERRKGQDLALTAFARFAATRPDALLVTSWHGLAPELAVSLDASERAPPVCFGPDGKVDVMAWAAAAGVADSQILDLGMIPNAQMPPILREMDAAIFPNRAEGGTNLVAMECMACGVPTILSRNTGHLDLIEDGNCLTLDSQGTLEGNEAGVGDVAGWGESDVDEIVEALERLYRDREAARAIGLAGAETLKRFTWAETARQMKLVALETPRTDP